MPKIANREDRVIDMSLVILDFTPGHKPVSRDNGRVTEVEVIASDFLQSL